MTPAEQVAAEIEIRLRGHGFGEAVIARALALNERVYDYQRDGSGAEALDLALAGARVERWFGVARDIPGEVYPFEEYAWWRSVMDFEPLPLWEQVDVPVLLLKGGRDDRSPPTRCAPGSPARSPGP